MSLIDNFNFIVGQAPEGFEFLPYIIICCFLYMICRFIFEVFIFIFGIIIDKF